MKVFYQRQLGFTLIELMIVVAIMGILSSIAIPSYVEHVRKGKRADAKVELLKIAQMQESFYVQNMSYARNLGSGAGGLGMSGTVVNTEQNEYTVTMTRIPGSCNGTAAASCTGYTLTATPRSGGNQQGDVKCLGFTLTNTGVKGITASNNAAQARKCWQ